MNPSSPPTGSVLPDEHSVTAGPEAVRPADVAPTTAGAPENALPGHRLGQARKARGLTLNDVAGALKFGVRQIEALEADDYDALKGATFVRGFIRSYARFLKLDAEPLLSMLEHEITLTTGQVRPPEDTGVAMPLPGERRNLSWMIAAIVLMAIAAGLIVWHLVSPDTIVSLPGKSPSATAEGTAVAPHPANGTPATPAVADPPVAAPAPASPIALAAPAASVIAAPAATPAAAPMATTPGATAASLPPGMRQLVLTFTGKSWVEIKDASQRVVLSGEFPGGGQQVVTGKPPFLLWVGRASVVRVRDGEREIDLTPHARDEVARLTVD